MVIRNAIDLVMKCGRYLFIETAGSDDRGITISQNRELINAIVNGEWILGLPGLDRFVFVICVLERYSVHECAALLGKSLRDVNESRQRTDSELGNFSNSGSGQVEVCTL
jgi:hypothetical protein